MARRTLLLWEGGEGTNNAYLMVETSKLYKRSQDTSDLPYEAECILGADLLHAGAQGKGMVRLLYPASSVTFLTISHFYTWLSILHLILAS